MYVLRKISVQLKNYTANKNWNISNEKYFTSNENNCMSNKK